MLLIASECVCVCVCVCSSLLFLSSCSEQRKICKACYLVIENYLKGDSRKNENYLARFIEFFQTQVSLPPCWSVDGCDPLSITQVRMGLNAEEVMIEMVEDNE